MNEIGRRVAVAAVCGVVPLIGCVLSFDRYISLVLAALLITAAPTLLAAHLRSFGPGLAALLVMAVLVPLDVGTGESSAVPVGKAFSVCFLFAGFLFGTWLLRLAVLRRGLALDSSRIVVAALLFIGMSVLSFVLGQFPWFATSAAPLRAQVGGLGLFVLSGGIFLIVGHEVKSLEQLRGLTWLFLGAGGLAVAAMLIPGTDVSVGSVKITTQVSVGSLFFTWLVAMSLSQGIFNRGLARSSRVLLVAIGAAALGRCVLLTFSWVSGWAPALVAVGVILFFRFPRLVFCTALLLAAPTVLASGWLWSSIMHQESWSWTTRIEALKIMQQIIERNPLLGLGPANYRYYTPLFLILGYHAKFNSHNNYVDLLAQTGIVGLLAFAWFAVEAGRLALRLRAGAADGFVKAYAVGALAGLAGSLVAGFLADWIVPFVYNIGIVGFRSSLLFWFFLGGLLAIRRLADTGASGAAPIPQRVRDLAVMRAWSI